MKFQNKLIWILAILGILTVAMSPLFVTPESFSGNATVQALGRFHILLLHFPIALLMLIPLMEIAGMFKRWRHLRDAVPQVLILCAVLSIANSILGLLLAAGEGLDGELLRSHMLAGILSTILVICLAVVRSVHVKKGNNSALAAYLVLLVSGIGALIFGSHQGASMVHGEDYLYANLPEGIKTALRLPVEEVVVLDYDSNVYGSIIAPILEEHCYHCHDDSITKGNFSMDTHAQLLSGGKSGKAAIVPGDSLASELFRRITLERSDDKAMPPIEEPQLEENEIALLKWWIDGGAPEHMTVESLSREYYPEEIESIIDSMLLPPVPLDPLDWSQLETVASAAREDFGIDVIPYSQDPTDGVYVVARNAGIEIGKDTFSSLESIAAHVRSINLWNQSIANGSLSETKEFIQLEELFLNQTNVADTDLEFLSELKRLRSLNLHGTGISDAAVPVLSQLRSLRKLFLSGTQMTPDGIQQLKNALPNCEILWRDPTDIPNLNPKPIDIASSTFQAVPGWGISVEGSHDHGIGSTHGGVAVDKAGRIYVSSKTGIHIYSEDGVAEKAITGPAYSDIHSLLIVVEDEEEFLYAARNRNAEALKLQLDGEIVLRLPFPEASEVEGKFNPTAAVSLDDGTILVTDGYGTNKVFTFDASGTYLSMFGGKDEKDPSKFRTPHGIALDMRYNPARLLISDREKRRLVHFDMDGNYIEDVISDLRRPCAVAIHGEYVAVAELEGRVLILDGNNEIIHTLGDNPDESQWANFKVAPDAWENGVHTAPHGLAWDALGNLYVQDWNAHGRITKWLRVDDGSSY